MKQQGSLPHLQAPAVCPYPEYSKPTHVSGFFCVKRISNYWAKWKEIQ